MSRTSLKLRVSPAAGEPFDQPLDDVPLVVGGAPGRRLGLADEALADEHLRIFERDGELWAEDLGAAAGCWLNGRPLVGEARLKDGDLLTLGASRLAVERAETTDAGSRVGLGTPLFRSASQLLDAGEEPPSDRAALERRAERLLVLNEVHRALARPMQLAQVLELILDRVFGHLRPEQGAIYLRRADGEHRVAAARAVDGEDGEPVSLSSRSLEREVSDKGMAALVLDLEHDERFAMSHSIQSKGIRSLVAAPLLGAEGSLGMIVLSSMANKRRFSEGDMELLVSLAAVAALSIRNVELSEELVERRRTDKEMALARRIQVALLPARLPRLDGWQLHAGNVPSRAVSGDYYLAVKRDGGRQCVLMIADVAGKGIAASLLTASLEALAAGPIEDGLPAEEICNRLSRQLYARTPPERYATAVLAVLDPADGVLRWANAGHVAPLVLRHGGEVERLSTTGPPLGLVKKVEHRGRQLRLEPGDFLMLYTDGITETADAEDRDYGSRRLAEVCRRHTAAPLTELGQAIERDLKQFAGPAGVGHADDRTFVMLRRDG